MEERRINSVLIRVGEGESGVDESRWCLGWGRKDEDDFNGKETFQAGAESRCCHSGS